MTPMNPMITAPRTGERILAFGVVGYESDKGWATVAWNTTYSHWQLDPSEASEYDPEPCSLDGWFPLPPTPEAA